MAPESHSRWHSRAGILALALVLVGCSDSGSPPLATQPAPGPGFAADSPVNAVRLLEWSWNYRDLDRFEGLLTEDFTFGCAAFDSAGNAFRDRALARFDEIESARHLFAGGGSSPPATYIALRFDQNLIPEPDSRTGKQNPAYHQEVATSVVLRIRTDDEEFQVTGAARFFLVRGDSAVLPEPLVARGARPDPGRWYIERWEDESWESGVATARVPDGPRASSLRALPARKTTWCSIKVLYR